MAKSTKPDDDAKEINHENAGKDEKKTKTI